MNCILLLLLSLVAMSCATTNYAKIEAYGIHAITPYGIISMGVLSYEREAGEGKKAGKTTEESVKE